MKKCCPFFSMLFLPAAGDGSAQKAFWGSGLFRLLSKSNGRNIKSWFHWSGYPFHTCLQDRVSFFRNNEILLQQEVAF